jgi:hypothetical protein
MMGGAKAAGRFEDRQQQLAKAPLVCRSGAGLEPRAKRHDELTVADAGGAGRFAGEAAEAPIDVGPRVVERQIALECLFHQHDSAARRVHLLAEHLVGRAGGEAETAVDAGGDGASHRLAVSAEVSGGDLVLH